MNISFKQLFIGAAAVAASAMMQSCEDGKSYAEMLTEENKAVNLFLVDQKVEGSVPADSIFEVGDQAPYYQLDEEGNIFMKVLALGEEGNVEEGQQVIFRFRRTNLMYYYPGVKLNDLDWEGNIDNPVASIASFRYGDYTLPSSAQWGSAIQLPLSFKQIQLGSRVMLVIKSQYGWSDEITYVQPYLYEISYNKRES